jgi:hypothetical protein
MLPVDVHGMGPRAVNTAMKASAYQTGSDKKADEHGVHIAAAWEGAAKKSQCRGQGAIAGR